MDPSAEPSWFFAVGGQQTGPVTFAALVGNLRAGQLGPGTLVWTRGMAEWLPAAQVDALRDVLPAAPPTVPGPIRRSEPPNDLGQNAGIRMLIPVGRSHWAIMAGYFGLLGLFPLIGLVFAPAAIVCGVKAIRHIKRDPRQHGMGRAVTGIVLGGIGSLASLFMLVGILMALAGK
jgi:hypothetical protein